MADNEQGSNSVAIVALIVVGVLIAGGGVLYYTGAIGGGTASQGNTTIIEGSAKEAETKPGFSLKYEDKDGSKGEIETP